MIGLWTGALAATLTVGPDGAHATPCAAIAAAAEGDTIEVDAAGDYAGDTCAWSTDRLTIRGVNGRPVLDGTGVGLAQQKGIFVIQAPTATVENLEFRGAQVADHNGAGIRHQGTDLLVRDCAFVDNENGILGSPTVDGTGRVEIVRSAFEHNGAGDGYSHNLYLGHYAEVSFQASYSHRGKVGHLLKSRAAYTEIVASRLSDEAGGAASYEIDLPNGGEAWIVGSVVEQVGTTENSAIVSFGAEGAGGNTVMALHVLNSTLVNHHDRGSFLSVGSGVTTPVEVVNTVFVGPGTLSTQVSTTFVTSWDDSLGDAGLRDAAALDLVPTAASALVDAGTTPTTFSVDVQYVHPAGETPRGVGGAAIDIGAYEYGNPGADDLDTGDADTAGGDADTAGDGDAATACGCGANAPSGAAAALLGLVLLRRRRRR